MSHAGRQQGDFQGNMTDEQKSGNDTSVHDATAGVKIKNPERLIRNIIRFLEGGGKVLSTVSARPPLDSGPYSAASELSGAGKVAGEVAKQWMKNPVRMLEAQRRLAQSYMQLWGRSMRRALGEDVEPLIKPDPGDKRFSHEDWSKNQIFDFWKQAYLLT
ncbi:MAG: hypothetical protein D6773_01135, partial [Alphaproteobacteria bacterium]